MADSKISALAALATSAIAAGDLIPIVDVSDTSMAGSGTNKVADASKFAYLDKAQTFSALKTFSVGLSFGDDTLAAYKIGTWTPVITAGTTNPTITYGSQDGAYIRIGGVVFYDAVITITAITVAGAGEWRFSLPLTVGRTMQGVAMFVGTPPSGGVDVPDDTVSLYFRAVSGGSYGVIRPVRDNAPVSVLGDSAFAAGDTIAYTGFYFL
jgi:hypothetical protein